MSGKSAQKTLSDLTSKLNEQINKAKKQQKLKQRFETLQKVLLSYEADIKNLENRKILKKDENGHPKIIHSSVTLRDILQHMVSTTYALANEVIQLKNQTEENLRLEETLRLEEAKKSGQLGSPEKNQEQLEEENKEQLEETKKTLEKKEKINTILSKVNLILKGFSDKTKQIGHHFSEAKTEAKALYNSLLKTRDQYVKDLTAGDEIEAGKKFKNRCEEAIVKAMPILQRDLGWGEYLKNLLKSIVNAVHYVVTAGNKGRFFPYTQSDISQEATLVSQKLQTHDEKEKPKNTEEEEEESNQQTQRPINK